MDSKSAKWDNPSGWGARHVHDKAPFSLWDEKTRQYRMPSAKSDETKWIQENFGDGEIGMSGWYIQIPTSTPPTPLPLTLGCTPVLFLAPGQEYWEPIPPLSYSNPRLPDPCPDIQWPGMTFPSPSQNSDILTALQSLANVKEIIYMPNWNIIVLDHGDGRSYGWKSLHGIVAKRTALWHHDERAFEDVMRDWKGMRGGSACDEWGGGKQGWFVPRYCYAETSKELLEGEEGIKQGSWDEQADGMSLLTLGRRCRKPERGGEKGGDEISYGEWEVSSISMVLGVVDETT